MAVPASNGPTDMESDTWQHACDYCGHWFRCATQEEGPGGDFDCGCPMTWMGDEPMYFCGFKCLDDFVIYTVPIDLPLR